MYLYMFYLGGNAKKSNIEVHDIQFVAAQKPEDAWPALREAWFGDPDKVHIDGYARITWVDGYAITLSDTPPIGSNKLFFVNVGAYHPSALAELHAFDLFVASNAQQAKAKGLATLLNGAQQQHKDNLKEVDDCLLLDKINNLYVHLTSSENGEYFRPEWQGYQPIGI
ncbi:DUF1543 domain-containing protein [Yersinia kristensenii]|uniref:DUF1543 domain-containing protein n=1 Tax=Yersinia kristensenii TaxID=28152 RepID=UPI001556F3D2|nr:DUF1543 domain-containing protein [Yersinia kristensenii]MDA5521065.1 DUF1543 domain-containing protein [Yersinia kristensenii]MDR4897204.1 DUF1543 domain-containing protein [Yersinia kristensenii]MDX6737047.1 DUF1543 domain-containing protein [Yersinia kristensenii]